MIKPLVTVIMNCHNSGRYLKESLDSVLDQSYHNWEIVFWDNQSTDDSADIFNSYNDKRFRYFPAPKYTALGEARNLAIEKARGEYIAFLDCDDIWLPKKLDRQLPLFEDESVGIVICDTVFFNNKKEIRQLYKRKKPVVGYVFRELLGDYFISLETAIIRRAVLEEMDHWLDTRFEVIEEYDFFVRIGYHWKLAFVDEVLAKWRVHEASWTWSRPELFPAETRKFLMKMEDIIPDFDSIYADEILVVRTKIAVQEAVIAWRNGGAQVARNILKPYRGKSFHAWLIMLWALLLPYKTFDLANRLRIGLLS